jgi:N-methylhydantoinase A
MNAVLGKIVGVDVGGTFTDLFYYDEDAARFRTAKVPSNRGDEAVGFLEGLKTFGPLAQLGSIVHGTTGRYQCPARAQRRAHRPYHDTGVP